VEMCADRVGVITSSFGDLLIDQGIDEQRISVLPNSTTIASAHISTAAARRRLGWTRDAFTVVHTGDMSRNRGLESVVEAARLSDTRDLGIEFVLVGDGDQRAALEAQGAGIRSLSFVPTLEGDDYSNALVAADALLLNEQPGVGEMNMPSEEGGTTASAVREHEAAAIIPPGDPERLLQAAQDLRWDTEQPAHFFTAAQRMLQNHDSPVSAHARYVRFAQALSSGGSGCGSSARSAPRAAGGWSSGRASA
jgi:colanic acid biosynthesis glycosyl transferase WcaI